MDGPYLYITNTTTRLARDSSIRSDHDREKIASATNQRPEVSVSNTTCAQSGVELGTEDLVSDLDSRVIYPGEHRIKMCLYPIGVG